MCESLFAESWFGNCLLRIQKRGGESCDLRATVSTFERKKKKYRWLYAQALNAMSDGQSSINEISKALDHANRSMQVSEQIGDAGGVLRNLQQLMSMHLKLGNYHEVVTVQCMRASIWHLRSRQPLNRYGVITMSTAF